VESCCQGGNEISGSIKRDVFFFFQLGTTTFSNKHSAPSVVFRKTMKSDCNLRHISVCLFVRRSAWNSAPTGRIVIAFDICVFFENLSRLFKFL